MGYPVYRRAGGSLEAGAQFDFFEEAGEHRGAVWADAGGDDHAVGSSRASCGGRDWRR